MEHDCMCKVLFRIRGNVRWNFAKSSEFTRHIATVGLLEITSIHTISSGCIEINVQSWFLRVTNKGINASIVKYVDRLFRVVSALGEENFLRYHLKRALIFTVLSSFSSLSMKAHEFNWGVYVSVKKTAETEEMGQQWDLLHVYCCLLPLPKSLECELSQMAVSLQC